MQVKYLSAPPRGVLLKVTVFAVIAGALLGLHLRFPGFFLTLWNLAACGDIHGSVAFLQSFGSSAIIVSFLILVAFNALGFLPNFFLLAANGMLFGIVGGTVLSWAGECVGAAIGFYLMRTTIRGYALSAIARAGYLGQVDDFSSHNGFRAVFLTRALPYIPSGLVTAASAISCISFKDFFWATLLGKLPSTIVEVMVGHDLADYRNHVNRLVFLAAIATSAYVLVWWRKRRKRVGGENNGATAE